jgi:Icc-related predicted phosphoesterase
MIRCFFVTDLHGHIHRYEKLFEQIRTGLPDMVFMGGDLLPHRLRPQHYQNQLVENFLNDYLMPECYRLKKELEARYPTVVVIMGNDDARSEESTFMEGHKEGLWNYLHFRKMTYGPYSVFGYSYVPPTPFRLKDWERYDVSRFVDPGCIHPLDGFRTIETNEDVEHSTIKKDLELLTMDEPMDKSIFLFHSPPYKTDLDRAALDGMTIDHVPLDVHVGSIAIMEMISIKQPLLTLHGHIHESTRLTGNWQQQFGRTLSLNAAWDGPELSLVKFDLENPARATRVLL